MANQKNADPALVQKKLAVLNPQLKALEEQRAACEDPRKQKLLEKKIEKVHDKIRQAKTGERFSRQPKRLTPLLRPTLSGLPFSPWGL